MKYFLLWIVFFPKKNECHANELLPTISNSPQQFGNSTKLPNDVI